jgi:hypothetical protein
LDGSSKERLMSKTHAAKEILSGDTPKEYLADDAFGFGELVAMLASALNSRMPATGYVLGVEGKWGSGKSSFVNFLSESLNELPTNFVFRFEPWLVGDKHSLIPAFLGEFADQIDKAVATRLPLFSMEGWRRRREWWKLSRTIRKYGRYIGKLSAPGGCSYNRGPIRLGSIHPSRNQVRGWRSGTVQSQRGVA